MEPLDSQSNASKSEDFPEPFEPITNTNLDSCGISEMVKSVNRLKFFKAIFFILIELKPRLLEESKIRQKPQILLIFPSTLSY